MTFSKIFGLLIIFSLVTSCQKETGEYVCTPCDLSCDKLSFHEAGNCPHCNMPLVKLSDLKNEENLKLNEIAIHEGSGVFLIEGGEGNQNKAIKVFYHRPSNFTKDSKVLLVIPGAGRNGDSYRDAWIPESETEGILIITPMYEEDLYPFEAYHLGGIIQDLNLQESMSEIPGTNQVKLDEEKFHFTINPNHNTWLFEDFDRIFDLVIEASASNQKTYDIFGHSAGGQILHRFAILKPDSKADRIIAGNSGFFTMPDTTLSPPFGIKGLGVSLDDLKASFQQNLILLLGKNDNETETGGTMLRSPTADLQGIGRFARGQYFFEESKKLAEQLGYEFNWKLVTVPNVGHDQELMGNAAAKVLY
ncbi:pimeloyl-ACP methyl ester carboxylesterase/DNA-directed RNA polymerase subunit RPC12/RpoP [Algoriphagus iocasae]|uniref:Pimeloyl-ACP methyl ester carboxylesterase/DNA-directed RNA polymerase subunit RPC12/RpoP n=1 Tax=Algoriphagus iocasae TaxID=1836499 RepID=A0A841MYJ6_9BACT|nr:hypothetical protein [Algoriphagus iocasae]MBB6327535.1 pimeloyl-ACP methyl ester carboxylesterase/DNA-directed RNA polymerase subunit RPC12/RpoP [Algoriphagus iocasae]